MDITISTITISSVVAVVGCLIGVLNFFANRKKANKDDEKDDYSAITPTGFKQKKYDTDIGFGYHRCCVHELFQCVSK